jgi:D-lactate dehydrogenase (cytochrome)
MSIAQSAQTLTTLFKAHQLALNPVELITYEVDAGFDRGKPDGVFYPESVEDVSRLMRWAHETKTPLVARGAGTGLSGGAVAEEGGIIIEFSRMNRLLELDVASRSGVVEPGLVNLTLDGEARKRGLYFPPDPSSQRSSVLGGNIGENSGGPHCFKYGVTTNYVTGLEVVLANGKIITVGGPALDYPGYDFCGALVGSEGTLGVFTKAHVRFLPDPPAVRTLMVAFPTLEAAGNAVSAIIAAGLTPATLEMMDQKIMHIIEAYAPSGLPVNAGAGLIIEVDGYPAGLDSQMEEIADILTEHGGFNLRIAQSEAERQQIWYGRKSVAGAFARLSPNTYLVDVTVPRSRLADMLTAVDQVCERHNVQTGHVFHAGDGNLHPVLMCDVRDAALMARIFAACDEIIDCCVERGGSITGEHGVGIEKRRYMPAMYSGSELAAMLDLKAIFDPHHLLNPGKIFPAELPAPLYTPPQRLTDAIFAPTTAQEAAAGLAACSTQRQAVHITSQSAPQLRQNTLSLTTRNLVGIRTVAAADLYVTVGAGTPAQEVTAALAAQNLQTALCSPWPAATVGDLLSANVNPPHRTRYGALRDNLLSTTVALADGRVIQAGRVVVKNVAGYDLPKLLVGGYGTLGLMTEVTLKLYPRPRAQQSLVLPVATPADGMTLVNAMSGELRVNAGVVLCPAVQMGLDLPTPYALVLTAEGIPEDVTSELAAIQGAIAPLQRHEPLTGATTATTHWADFLGAHNKEELLIRVGVPAKQLATYLVRLGDQLTTAEHWLLDPLHGLLYLRHRSESAEAANRWLTGLRTTAELLDGYAVAMAVPGTFSGDIERWGVRAATQALMTQLKQRWDPQGILI